jgi:hypothetical protein
VKAARVDDGANIWLLISAVGAGAAGTIKLLLNIETDVVWEIASLMSVALTVRALWKRAPEIKHVVFESIVVFDRLATEVEQATISFRSSGSEAAIAQTYLGIYNTFSGELKVLGRIIKPLKPGTNGA